jgi:rhodanese-related sulfurtransferase
MRSRRIWLNLVLVLVLLAVAACGDSDDDKEEGPATFTTISVQQAYDDYTGHDNTVMVDVRNADEWATTGVPPGAELTPLDQLTRGSVELPKDAEIYVICNSGNRSQVASQYLIDLGYRKVFNVDGGFQAWLRAGLPTEPYP